MKAKLTEGPVLRHLLEMTLPLSVGVFAIIGFNLVDTYFVSLLGKTELAAMTFTFPIPIIIGSVAFGIGIGVSSIVARAIGERNHKMVCKITTDSLSLVVLIVSIISIVCSFNIDRIFTLMGANEKLLPHIKDYMQIWFLSAPLIVIPMTGNSAIRATGDTRFPAFVMIVAGLINGIMDPILIFGLGPIPALGLQGAAFATLIGRFFTLAASLWALHYKLNILINPFRSFSSVLESWKKVLYLGIPGVLNNLIMPVTMIVITKMISSFGEDVVAGFGLASRIESFMTIILIGMSASLGPIVGQNWGARKSDRIKTVLKYSHTFSVLWTLLCYAVISIFGEEIVALFSNNQQVQDLSLKYLHIVTLSMMGTSVLQNTISSYNAIGKPRVSFTTNFIKMFGVYIPLGLLLKEFYLYQGIFFSSAIANFTLGAVALYLSVKLFSQEFKSVA